MFSQRDNGVQNGLEGIVAKGHSVEHHVFRQFGCFGLNHQHAFGGASHNQIQLGVLHLLARGVEDERAILEANACSAHRAKERNTRKRQRCGATDQGGDIGAVFHIVGQHRGDNLHFVTEAFGEERADGPVDQARNQRFVLGRTAFTLEKATGDLARSVGFFLIVDGQGKEILPGLDGTRAHGGTQHHGFAIGNQHRAIGLTGDLAGFENQRATAPFDFFTVIIKHSVTASIKNKKRQGRQNGTGGRTAPRTAWRLTATPPRRHVVGNAVAEPARVASAPDLWLAQHKGLSHA